ncbi:hypothetical protein FACS1894151_07260 [Spirochaetia bacterium]|nr:hypothetical protein FACS1894151_07260 [Spirochaetia bacterium]
MQTKNWAAFSAVKEKYRAYIEKLSTELPDLQALQQKLVNSRSAKAYTVETSVVYNQAIDDFGPDSEIKLILVADNPGRREQAAENRRYLVGPSGKIAENFFRNNSELGIDFRRNVLILNKTPVHTPRTAELRELAALGTDAENTRLARCLIDSQKTMASLLAEFYAALAPDAVLTPKDNPLPVWMIGYSEMKKKGIFEAYTAALVSLCAEKPALESEMFFYRHFSMNQFTFDLKDQRHEGETTASALKRIGTAYRERIFGPFNSGAR